MPRQTWIKHYVKHIAGSNNGDFIGGRFSQQCASCINVDFAADSRNLPDRLSRLEAILMKSTAACDAQMQALTDAVLSMNRQICELTAPTPAAFPVNT